MLPEKDIRSFHACRTPRHRRVRRAGFSLAELIVAIGVLLLMMGLVGQVFTFTVQSTGQAMALTDLNRQLRELEFSLREDLRHVQPGSSLMLIQGNPVNAYWSRDGRAADNDGNPLSGYPHVADPERERSDKGEPLQDTFGQGIPQSPRADMLMFFTARKGRSHVYPEITGNLQQVVYGHAVLGEWVPKQDGSPTGEFEFREGLNPFPLESGGYPSTTAVSPIAAQDWHLARRSVLLFETPIAGWEANNLSALAPENIASFWWDKLTPARNANGALRRVGGLNWPGILQGRIDVVTQFPYETVVLRPFQNGPWYLPEVFFGINDTLFNPLVARSRLDPSPPARMAKAMGHYLLPQCASFKVEWTLDPRSAVVDGRLDSVGEVLWFDPGFIASADNTPSTAMDDTIKALQDTRAARCLEFGNNSRQCRELRAMLESRTARVYNPQIQENIEYSVSDRFRPRGVIQQFATFEAAANWEPLPDDSAVRKNTVVFLGTLPIRQQGDFNGIPYFDYVPDPFFPSALRITVDVFDREGRLERPVRHVMILPVGR